MIYGVNDGTIAQHWPAASPVLARLGRIQVGVWISWRCDGPQALPVWQIPKSQPVLLTVLGSPWSCSTRLADPHERTRFARFVRSVVQAHRNVREVQVWNEPDLAFWQANTDAYVRTLARVRDLLPRRVKVLGPGFSPNAFASMHAPVEMTVESFAASVAAFYSVTQRRRPIVDGFSYHPYWGFDRATTSAIATALDETWTGLPQPSPSSGLRFWWTETGAESDVATSPLPGLYFGQPNGWPAYLNMLETPDAQAAKVHSVARRAYRDPLVAADFNFLLRDECNLARWQSGLLWASGEPKPAYFAFRDAIARAARRPAIRAQVPGTAPGTRTITPAPPARG